MGQRIKWVVLYEMLQNYRRLRRGNKIKLPTLFVIQQSNGGMIVFLRGAVFYNILCRMTHFTP